MTAQIETQKSGGTLRSIGAVLAGLVAVAALSTLGDVAMYALKVYPPPGQPMKDPALFALATGYRCVFTILGGYLAARLAPSRPLRHAVILGGIGTLLALAGLGMSLAHPEMGPLWYPVALVVTALPCCWLGGLMRRKA